jgi:type II secretory pathway component PulM
MFERLSDMLERMGPRERRLLGLLGVVGVSVAVLYVAFLVQDGLHALERYNDDTRSVLATLDSRREELIEARSKQGETVAMIGDEAQALPTYLEKVGSETGVQIRAQAEKPTVAKGKFHEHSTQISLFDVSLEQLAQFLRGIETQSPVVVTQRLLVKRAVMQKERLDRVEITVATYSRAPARRAATPAGPATGAGEGRP